MEWGVRNPGRFDAGSRPPVTVALVNDYDVVLRGLQAMLEPFASRVRVVDVEVGSDDVADADIALFDTFGGKHHIIDRACDLLGRGHVRRVVLYTRDASPRFVAVAKSAGVSEVLVKTTTGEELVEALERIAAGEHPAPITRRTTRQRAGPGLDARDWELIALLGLGLSNEQIADESFIGIDTVRGHLRVLYRKLGVNSRAQAAQRAAVLGPTSTRLAARVQLLGRRQSKRFRRVPEDIPAARRFVTDTLRAAGATERVVGTFRLAASELAANVVEHGSVAGWVLGVKVSNTWFELDVVGGRADKGSLVFHPDRWSIADVDERSGRGLGILREVMDTVAVDEWRGQIRVRCRLRRWPEHPAASSVPSSV